MIDADTCYRALAARDARYDGRFFTAVRTTRIYCRPVCPARTPRRENVRFFPCAAAAEAAGYRPCRRCRPDAAPGTPAWLGTSTTVSRALQRIDDGDLDRSGVEGLAGRLGIGARHLRRLFLEHLGAAPHAVALTRRVHFARRLLDETSLPVTEVAYSSGFSSLRRFHDAMRRTYGRPPRALRADRLRPPRTGDIELRLPLREPFDWDGILDFLATRATPGVEEVSAGVYRRAATLDGFRGIIEIRRPDPQCVVLSVPAGGARALLPLVERTRRLFDLDADAAAIGLHLSRDPVLRHLLRRRPGLRVPGAWDGFELAVRAILGQQVTVRAATTLAGRLASRFGEPLQDGAGRGVTRFFPLPGVLAGADLSGIGLPAARQRSIQALARAVRDGDVDLESSSDLEATLARLRALPGIGPWTAEYIALRALSNPDAFPAGDLGVRRALSTNDRLPSERETVSRAEAWRPWRAYATILLWTGGGDR